MREWLVAGALLELGDEVLLVRNQRRSGLSDWSTPGGVIDASDDSLLAGLTREVEEETGLRVTRWEGPLYEVRAVAVDLGWTLRCEVHRAVEFEGELRVDDPDGIVVEAAFVARRECAPHLEECAPWVREPLAEWLAESWGPDAARGYHYDVRGNRRDDLDVRRVLREGDSGPDSGD
jgi:8-oxo-dGTP diphosphatase